jgi:AAA+ superfamily predicted ATPase
MMEHSLPPTPPPWRVLLLGGASGAGKTVLAQSFARHYGVSLLLVDDVRLALQQVATPKQQPALHYFLTTPCRSTGPGVAVVGSAPWPGPC